MPKKIIFPALIIAIAAAGAYLYFNFRRSSARTAQVFDWFRDTISRPDLMMSAGTRCGDAPFIFPTDSLIGFIWDDSFRPGHRHSGIDIFSGTKVSDFEYYAGKDRSLTYCENPLPPVEGSIDNTK